MEQLPAIAIIGPGKVGTSIGVLARKAGYRIAGISGRDEKEVKEAAKIIGGDVEIGPAAQAIKGAQLVLLTLSDDAIESVCRELANYKAFSKGQIVAHCSGALSSQVLVNASDKCGAKIASAHPLKTFPTVQSGIDGMSGTYWFCEGDDDALAVIKQLIEKIGGMANIISSDQKVLYHAASVIACNYLTTLMDVALAAAEKAGLERQLAWKALSPLVHDTINNIDKLGTANALTGPIARGDAQTIEKHLKILDTNDPKTAEIYRALGQWTIKLASEKGSLPDSKQALLSQALS